MTINLIPLLLGMGVVAVICLFAGHVLGATDSRETITKLRAALQPFADSNGDGNIPLAAWRRARKVHAETEPRQ